MNTIIVKICGREVESVSFSLESVTDSLNAVCNTFGGETDEMFVPIGSETAAPVISDPKMGYFAPNEEEEFIAFDGDEYPELVSFLNENEELDAGEWFVKIADTDFLERLYPGSTYPSEE